MRAYIATTAVAFAALALVHLSRIALEGLGVARDPFFVATTVISVGFAGWAIRLLRAPRGPHP